jgi:hypothetical protein
MDAVAQRLEQATSIQKVDFSVARWVCRRDGFARRSFEMTIRAAVCT